jgi:hypothetical protein
MPCGRHLNSISEGASWQLNIIMLIVFVSMYVTYTSSGGAIFPT